MTAPSATTPPDKQLLWIRGSELGFGKVHMGAWGQSVRTPLEAGYEGIQPQIDTVRANGGILAINHPENKGAYGWDWKKELAQTSGYSVIEAFNGQHPVEQVGSEHLVDAVDLADDFRQIWWIGSDDCHDLGADSFDRYAVVVRTENPVADQQAILAAIDAGDMYIRETAGGPVIEGVAVAGNSIVLTLQDVAGNYDVIWKQRGNETVQVDVLIGTTADPGPHVVDLELRAVPSDPLNYILYTPGDGNTYVSIEVENGVLGPETATPCLLLNCDIEL